MSSSVADGAFYTVKFDLEIADSDDGDIAGLTSKFGLICLEKSPAKKSSVSMTLADSKVLS